MHRLRVGLLLYALDRPLSGVTRVALELARALARREDCEVVYLTTFRGGPFWSKLASRAYHLPGCALLPGLMALGGPLLALAARRLNLDVIHDPNGISPFPLGRWAGGFRRVVTIHDAIAFRYPEGYPLLNNLLHRRYVPATLANVDLVLTDSEHARAEVLECYRPSASVQTVPLGVSPLFHPVPQMEAAATAWRYGLDGPYLLTVGAQQDRKNLRRLLEAFVQVRWQRPDLTLAVVGPRQWEGLDLAGAVTRLDLSSGVRLLGYVPEADLPALYSGAQAFVFPSLYEGFGLPPLEAMACGTPVVCSRATSLPEVVGSAAVLVDPLCVDDLAHGMQMVLGDAGLAAELRRWGIQRAAGFTWEATAERTMAAYRGELMGAAL